MRADYDIVVVGAGPAGSWTAYHAAKKGARVLMIEKRQEIGDPVRCAEGVSKRTLCQMVKPEPEWIASETIETDPMNSPAASHAVAIQKIPSWVCQVLAMTKGRMPLSGMP